jgi:hypothetical protein
MEQVHLKVNIVTYSEAILIALSDLFIGFGEVVVNVRVPVRRGMNIVDGKLGVTLDSSFMLRIPARFRDAMTARD